MTFRHPAVLVQVTHAVTGELVRRVPGIECRGCGDIVLGAMGIDGKGRCACCARAAREKSA